VIGVEREVGRKFGRWLDVVLMQRLIDRAEKRA
jgi:L-amino acid N-acyltransferase YncA